MRTATAACSFVSALAVAGCIPASRPDPAAPAYSAEASLDGITIRVDLYHDHELLAEYRKVVEVRKGGGLVATREYSDTGGHASFYLLRDGTRVTVVDGVVRGFVLDAAAGTVVEVVADDVPRDFPERSFGRFMFVSEPKRQYRWFLREELPEWVKR